MAKIGVAISGGGHRAALFGLGALLYLVDSDRSRDVASIASVSGGSLTNGFVAQSVDYRSVEAGEFRTAMRPLARRLATKGTLLPPSPLTLAYLALLLLVFLAAIIGVWFLPWKVGYRVLAFVVGLLLLGVVANLRGLVASRAFARTLFSPKGRPTQLASITTAVDHAICAADLHAGENVYFSGAFVCSYRLGWGTPGDLPLHVAVQASAALPGAFPPRWLRTSRHGFVDGRPEAADATRMALVDGGVYDNMADQWGLGIVGRKRRWPEHAADLHQPEQLVIVNASAGLEWEPIWKLRVPLVGEILALLKDKSVLYDNGNAVRRELAVERFRAGRLEGALVHIPQSPLRVADAYASGSDDISARARAVIELLGPDRSEWEAIARANPSVTTGLSPLGAPVAARLVRHAYALTMANLHVLMNLPLLQVPSAESFEDLMR